MEWEEGQPRLLLISVDVTASYYAVFNSYKRRDGIRCTEYGRHIKKDEGITEFEYVIRYDEGINSLMLLLVQHPQLTMIM